MTNEFSPLNLSDINTSIGELASLEREGFLTGKDILDLPEDLCETLINLENQ